MSLKVATPSCSRALLVLCLALLLGACSMSHLKANLGNAVLDNDDLALVGEGLPTYMLMMDGMVRTWPKDADTLAAAARLYSSYAGLYVENDKARAQAMSRKALDFALRAACADEDDFCQADTLPLDRFEKALAGMDDDNLPVLFTLGSAWAGWIQQNTGDWNAIAQLARVRMIMERVVAIDSGYNLGQAHMYLGVLSSLLPAALGGEPEKAKVEFEKAIELSSGKNLLARVFYAKQYALPAGNKALFDALMDQVEKADPHAPGLTLQNVYAKKLVGQLKEAAAEQFED